MVHERYHTIFAPEEIEKHSTYILVYLEVYSIHNFGDCNVFVYIIRVCDYCKGVL